MEVADENLKVLKEILIIKISNNKGTNKIKLKTI